MSKNKEASVLETTDVPPLLGDIRGLIENARSYLAQTANSALTMLYWHIGERIRREVLQGQRRAGYGEHILSTLSVKLEPEFGRGFGTKNLSRMVQFVEVFPNEQIVVTLSRQLGWSHFLALLPLKRDLQREFYAEMCRVERWSVRTLRERINSQLYERTALSKKPEQIVESEIQALRASGQLTPDLVFRDPYVLDFLGLPDGYSEKDLEAAILREMEGFLLELGAGFSFIARQKRITVGNEDYYIDLLFYHRPLRRLVAVELKLERFQAAHKGQMELYLRWLDKFERQPHEEAPMGLILCAGADVEHVELLQLDQNSIRVAEYLTELPSMKVLRDRLHRAIEHAQEKIQTEQLIVTKEE